MEEETHAKNRRKGPKKLFFLAFTGGHWAFLDFAGQSLEKRGEILAKFRPEMIPQIFFSFKPPLPHMVKMNSFQKNLLKAEITSCFL